MLVKIFQNFFSAHLEETAVGKLRQVAITYTGIHGGNIKLAVMFAHAPDVLVERTFHQFGEVAALLELASGIVELPYFLRIVQGVVNVFKIVGRLHVLS